MLVYFPGDGIKKLIELKGYESYVSYVISQPSMLPIMFVKYVYLKAK